MLKKFHIKSKCLEIFSICSKEMQDRLKRINGLSDDQVYNNIQKYGNTKQWWLDLFLIALTEAWRI